MRAVVSTAVSVAVPALPSALAVPAGAPGPVVLTLGVIGLLAGTGLALIREAHRHSEARVEEAHRHAETLKTLHGRPDIDATTIVAVLRGAPPRNTR